MSLVEKSTYNQKISYQEAFNEYFKLKNDYNILKQKLINKLSKTQLSNNEKSKLFNQEIKCVRCKHKGGTIFENKDNHLLARCGNIDSPCKLNIDLQRATYKSIIEKIPSLLKNINDVKNNIIQIKLKFMYGYENEETTISEFTELKKKLITLVSEHKQLSVIFLNIFSNYDDKDKILSQQTLLQSEIINFINLIEQFRDTKENQFIKDAVELNINQIFKISKEISDLKYKIQFVYKNSNNEFILNQESFSLNIFDVKEKDTENKIISFIL